MISDSSFRRYARRFNFTLALLSATSALAQTDPRTFLNTTLDLIEHRAYRASSINWPVVRRQALVQADHARTTSEVYPLITAVLMQLGDHHSYLLPPAPTADPAEPQVFAGMHLRADEHTVDQVDVGSPADHAGIKPGDVIIDVQADPDGLTVVLTLQRTGQPQPVQTVLPVPTVALRADQLPLGTTLGRVGYLKLPGNAGATDAPESTYATTLQSSIQTQLKAGACGWLVDLRTNTGGNSYPMLTGLGPLYGEGLVLSNQERGQAPVAVVYRQGTTAFGKQVLARLMTRPGLPVTVPRPPPAIAVLIGPHTLSAGEYAAVAFHGLKNVRTFGLPTGGAIGYQTRFPLSDGSVLLLNTGVELDRTGKIIEEAQRPDVTVSFTEAQIGTSEDPVVKAAQDWVLKQSSCQRPSAGHPGNGTGHR